MSETESSPVAALLQSVTPGSDSALCGLDQDFRLNWVNEGFEILAGRKREDLVGRPLSDLFTGADRHALAEVFARVIVDGEKIRGHQARLSQLGGGSVSVLLSGMALSDAGDGSTVVMALERIPSVTEPGGDGSGEAYESSLSLATPASVTVPVQTDARGRCVHVGSDWTLLVGRQADEILGQPLMAMLHPEWRTPELARLLSSLQGEPSTWQGRVHCIGENDSPVVVDLHVQQILAPDGRFAGVSARLSDVPAHTAVRDSAAGVRDAAGRYGIEAGRPGQLVYDFDIASGEIRWSGAILQVTGERPEHFRNTDLSAWEQRIHPDDRPLVSERLRQTLESGWQYRVVYRQRRADGVYLKVEESATVLRDPSGIAYRMLGRIRLLDEEESRDGGEIELPRHARRQGRAADEFRWVERISRALRENRFRLYQQRSVRHAEGRAGPSELFLRMLDDGGEMLHASTFLPAAMRCNLMPLLDRWVIRQVCEGLAEGRGPEEGVSVNLALGSLLDGTFADFVERQMDVGGIDPAALSFEITESAVVTAGEVITFMRRMRQRGSQIILDNVGGGLCSLGYLRGLPVDALKIDGGFMRHLLEDPVDLAIVRSIVAVAEAMKVSVRAQNVEDLRVLDALADLNIEAMQGIALHAPEPWC